MKKIKILITLIVLTICITGCGNNEKNIENNSEETSGNENINKDVNYNELYYNKLIERHNNNDYENYGTYYKEVQWTMLDLTKDEIPELVLYFEGECSACKYMEFYTIRDNKVEELYYLGGLSGEDKIYKINGFTRIYKYNDDYYTFHFNQGYGWFGKIVIDNGMIEFEKVASITTIWNEEYENEDLYKSIFKDENLVKFKSKSEFVNNNSNKDNNGTNETKNNSNIRLNKYYVDAYEENPKKALSKKEVWVSYLKFIDTNNVEVNFTCFGEGMCQYKTKYESYFENDIEYVKIYETSEMRFMCSEGKGYALLKLDKNIFSVVTSDENYEGLDMAGAREYKLYEE